MRRLLNRRWLAVDLVVLAALALVSLAYFVIQRSQPPGPPWRGDLANCRTSPMQHVHNPQRLEILATCSTLSGTVIDVKHVPAYSDLKITIRPDDAILPFLEEANEGVVVADVIATDQVDVTAPPVGSRVDVWGSWVLDKATRATLMLPAYRLEVTETSSDSAVLRGQSEEKHGPALRRELKLTARTDPEVVVGGRIDVFLQATWLQNGEKLPASQIRLFAEMTTADGEGVRWKAAMTDTRGIAVLHLVAIQAPSDYQLTVYAAPSGQRATTTVPLRVTRA